MRRGANKLTAAAIRAANRPGLYSDGHCLCLQVAQSYAAKYRDGSEDKERTFRKVTDANAFRDDLAAKAIVATVEPFLTKSWIFRYLSDGKDRKVGLGSIQIVTLAEARRQADKLRLERRDGLDPLAEKRARRAAQRTQAAKMMTFKDCADAYIKANESTWKNEKHVAQWHSTFNETKRGSLKFPALTRAINDLPVAAIDTAAVLKVLEPIWYTTPETASRVRGRIERVLAWATVAEYRSGDNPARWTGNLKELLPATSKVAKVEHHDAVPYAEMPAYMAALREKKGGSARALEFTILTAARTAETTGARWSEIDLIAKVWTIPAERMKADREHRVPLSDRAVAVLEELPREGEFVFLGARKDKPLSNMAMLELVRGMRGMGATVHGFRSTFRDWAGNETSFPRELAEHALAHVIGDKAEQAYRREAAVQRRRKMMAAWAAYCSRPQASGGNVVPMRGRTS